MGHWIHISVSASSARYTLRSPKSTGRSKQLQTKLVLHSVASMHHLCPGIFPGMLSLVHRSSQALFTGLLLLWDRYLLDTSHRTEASAMKPPEVPFIALTGCTGTTFDLSKGAAASHSVIPSFAAAARDHHQDQTQADQVLS